MHTKDGTEYQIYGHDLLDCMNILKMRPIDYNAMLYDHNVKFRE